MSLIIHLFRYNDKGPLTAALHIQWGRHGTDNYNFIVGGKSIHAKFPLKKLMGLEDRGNGADTALVTVKINPEAIEFSTNKSVTIWKPITLMFPDIHVSEGANVRWDTKQVMARLRLRANVQPDSSTKPTLILEALVLTTGTWEAVAGPKQLLLSKNTSSAVQLWAQDCSWYSPLPQYKLPTVSGLMRTSLDAAVPGELKYRWTQQAILRRCDQGRSVTSKQEFEAYMEKPYQTVTTTATAYWLPYPFGIVDSSNNVQGTYKQQHSAKFMRKGKVIERHKPYLTPSAQPKFNTNTKGSPLSSEVLPQDAPKHLQILARNMFNASIAESSAKSYSTAAAHLSRLEAELGRTFSWPLSSQDYNLFMTYLMDKNISPATVKSYLSATRRLALTKGVSTPAPQSDLTKSILRGYENVSRNPILAVAKATHRPVTIPFLRILGHATHKYWKGCSFDQRCFWVICVTAFWGSLRIGEMLCDHPNTFSPTSDLLASDVIHMSPNSMALWLRDPKVPKLFGDVVEVWSTPHFPDLDPFKAFSAFWNLRNNKNFSLNKPLFLRADGRAFTHSSFSSTLNGLISHYSLELELTVNKWTGHSFRSGLPTLLQAAGFSEQDIKSWGRWTSTVWQIYARDISRRFEVQRSILQHMDRLKAFVEGS